MSTPLNWFSGILMYAFIESNAKAVMLVNPSFVEFS